MARKKKHEEHANHERWLVSYADFITLLFAFFVVMFATSQVDEEKTKQFSESTKNAFNELSVFSGLGIGGSFFDIGGKAGKSQKITILNPSHKKDLAGGTGGSSEKKLFASTGRQVDSLVGQLDIGGAVLLTRSDRGLVISIREAGMFKAGAEELTEKSQKLLRGLGDIMLSIPNQVRVEGHTDNRPVRGRHASNWELSSNRATYVVRWILKRFDLDAARFVAVGYGEHRPIADNSTEVGRLRNRRVDIVILNKAASRLEPKMPRFDVAELGQQGGHGS